MIMACCDHPVSYDIVIIGAKGQGKTTTARKILQTYDNDQSGAKLSSDPIIPGASTMLSTTNPELLVNNDINPEVRVLDMPGFSSSMVKGKIHIVRQLLRHQKQHKLKIRRVLYFLPNRGSLEKADGILLEELQALSLFYGTSIFKRMVVVATYSAKLNRQRDLIFDEEEAQETQKVFHLAIKHTVKDEDVRSPPIMFIGLDSKGRDILSNLKDANVLSDTELPPGELTEEQCSLCSNTVCYGRDKERAGVVTLVDGNEELIPYEESKCHTKIFLNYSRQWPLCCSRVENNTQRVCNQCNSPQGSEGCTKVGTLLSMEGSHNSQSWRDTLLNWVSSCNNWQPQQETQFVDHQHTQY